MIVDVFWSGGSRFVMMESCSVFILGNKVNIVDFLDQQWRSYHSCSVYEFLDQ